MGMEDSKNAAVFSCSPFASLKADLIYASLLRRLEPRKGGDWRRSRMELRTDHNGFVASNQSKSNVPLRLLERPTIEEEVLSQRETWLVLAVGPNRGDELLD